MKSKFINKKEIKKLLYKLNRITLFSKILRNEQPFISLIQSISSSISHQNLAVFFLAAFNHEPIKLNFEDANFA